MMYHVVNNLVEIPARQYLTTPTGVPTRCHQPRLLHCHITTLSTSSRVPSLTSSAIGLWNALLASSIKLIFRWPQGSHLCWNPKTVTMATCLTCFRTCAWRAFLNGCLNVFTVRLCLWDITLVNVNAPVVATTSWWLHFTAPVVA